MVTIYSIYSIFQLCMYVCEAIVEHIHTFIHSEYNVTGHNVTGHNVTGHSVTVYTVTI